jgi:hypothetical protein
VAGLLATLAEAPSLAITFTNDTNIGVGVTNYDGADIVVTNCTLTVDGPHLFASLLVAAGGVVTHSFFPSGSISNLLVITNELQFLTGTTPVTLLHSNIMPASVSVSDFSGTLVYTNGVDYVLSSPDGILTLLQRTSGSSIPDGTNVLVSYSVLLGVFSPGLTLSITGDLEVAVGGSLNVNWKGYGGALGPGAGRSASSPADGSGAGYGGLGGMSASNALGGLTYGSFYQPTNLGSGGGSGYIGAGGPGGGLINLQVGGNLLLNGAVSANGANGANSRSGGGSGGSVWLSAHTVAGTGSISASGGAGEPSRGGGGAGGRIALQCDANSFAGPLSAFGGTGAKNGGAGTVYTKVTGQHGLLVLDNGGRAGAPTPITISDIAVDVLIRGEATASAAAVWSIGNLTINSDGSLVNSSPSLLSLTVSGNVLIQPGGSLSADGGTVAGCAGAGYGRSYGDGVYWPCGGAGYGGNGANGYVTNDIGGSAYGYIDSPASCGSSGGSALPYSIGGNGGGAIRIFSIGGIVQVDGRISANGSNGTGSGGGGGSGGSVWIYGGTLLGSGIITANGGDGANAIGGGGGGGRIALTPTANLFGGTVSAFGGGGAKWGGAGTVYIQVPGQNGQLLVDNGSHVGKDTPLQNVSGIADLFVRNAAIGSASSGFTLFFGNLLLSAGGRLSGGFPSSLGTLNLTIGGNATIESGAAVIFNSVGYGPGVGPGAGRYYALGSTNVCGGAGHGGFGGASFGGSAAGGITYDSITGPGSAGSGGGTSFASLGGPGGGVIRLTVNGTLQLDGTLSANGGNGTGLGGGGGSGGSVWLTVGTLAGAGTISANGGNGVDSVGGGGGGGCIAIYPSANLFTGTISAYGGAGANWGGAGTIYLQTSGLQTSQLILDNGNHVGAATPILSTPPADLILRNGVMAFQQSPPQTFASLLIGSNAWFIANPTVPNGYPGIVNLTLTGNATLQAGGGILSDAAGWGAGLGSGAGRSLSSYPNYPCGGAGYGGYGANSLGNAASGGLTYGPPYGSITSPSVNGSGGGTYSPYSIGGAGGGSIRLSVNGTLQVAGTVSANGGNGAGLNGGGGSGGSVWLSAGTLTGTGSITANGGNGAGLLGGGGGGGRIAATCNNNTFVGAMSACGGGLWGGTGTNWGGAGTVYVKLNSQTYGLLTIDNGGHSGTNTTFDFPAMDLLVSGRGVAEWAGSASIRSLQVRSNSVLTVALSGATIITATGNATIDPGGLISADGRGISPGLGPGAGGTSAGVKGGGGHGGFGARNSSGFGAAYGSVSAPATVGSGGAGSVSAGPPYGGAGGGALRLAVTGTLAVNGAISASGKDGDINSGGGSGGSLWLTAGTLAGSGLLSANGGAGNGSGGGGGGGRISVGYNTKSFSGLITAYGGGGYVRGGAGTIYTKPNSQPVGQLLVDNGGVQGTNTPLSTNLDLPTRPFDLTVGPGASVSPLSFLPALSNLTIAAGGQVTTLASLPNLDLVVLKNALLATGSVISVDARGYSQGNGPGAGQTSTGYGSGAGYGGVGGPSPASPGGASYGSTQQPTDPGSGGGYGLGSPFGGSEGGGFLRLNVGGTLLLDGQLSANGGPALQDNAGGGSGGSIWVTTSTLTGHGSILANGGDGDFYYGGGGAGGRIALYSRANAFSGLAAAAGGDGYSPGANGTIFVSSAFAPLQVLSHSPTGVVSNFVSSVDLYFNAAPDPTSFAASRFSLKTPNGPLAPSDISIAMLGSTFYRVSFPMQTAVGNYQLTVDPYITDLFGQPLSQVYTGSFSILLPVIQGVVTNANGLPLAGVLLQPSVGLSPAITDTNGSYALGFVPGWSFTVTPSLGSLIFVPGSRSYSGLTDSVSNQNYLAVQTIAPLLAAQATATDFILGWQTISGVSYQIFSSTNLADWLPYGSAFIGSNAPVQILVPMDANSLMFFRVQSRN